MSNISCVLDDIFTFEIITINQNTTAKITFMNAPSGNYRVEFQVNGSSLVTVRCTIGDWW